MTGGEPARYRFGDGARVGVLLGMSLCQVLPIVVGVLWLTVLLMARLPLIGLLGPFVGCVVAFGRWRRAPLFEVAAPGVLLGWRRWRRRPAWHRVSLIAGTGSGGDGLPSALAGLELLDVTVGWPPGERPVAVVADSTGGSMSMVVAVRGEGFPVASPIEQDALVAVWGNALAPLARARCPVSRVTWQEWARPVGVDGHRDFLSTTRADTIHTDAAGDYEQLLVDQAPFTVAHEVLVTVTVDLRRVRPRKGVHAEEAAVEALVDEVRQLCTRFETAGLSTTGPLTAVEVATAVRVRSDPQRPTPPRRSLAAAVGRVAAEWGPMAVEPDWFEVRVDGSLHRSFRVAAWPMLPVGADWLGPLLTVDGATRTVTVVLEPVALAAAAQDANRQLTSIEADQQQKERHGFRLTARERRRHDDVATRERELAEGHPLFRHVGLVTVTAPDRDRLEEASARVEQAAAQSMLDLRPLAARQPEGWVASLPLGRSVKQGNWR